MLTAFPMIRKVIQPQQHNVKVKKCYIVIALWYSFIKSDDLKGITIVETTI